MVMEYVPGGALVWMTIYRRDEPEPGAAMVEGVKLHEDVPTGNPVAERAMAALNPPETVVVTEAKLLLVPR